MARAILVIPLGQVCSVLQFQSPPPLSHRPVPMVTSKSSFLCRLSFSDRYLESLHRGRVVRYPILFCNRVSG